LKKKVKQKKNTYHPEKTGNYVSKQKDGGGRGLGSREYTRRGSRLFAKDATTFGWEQMTLMPRVPPHRVWCGAGKNGTSQSWGKDEERSRGEQGKKKRGS